MALIHCPNCGGKISDKAQRCPHCQKETIISAITNIPARDYAKGKKWKVILIILLAMACGGNIVLGILLHNQYKKNKELELVRLEKEKEEQIVLAQVEEERIKQKEKEQKDSIQRVKDEIKNRISIETFCKWEREKGPCILDASTIFSNLNKLDFKLIDDTKSEVSKYSFYYIDDETEVYDFKRIYQREKYGFSILLKLSGIIYYYKQENCEIFNIEIDFPNENQRNNFIKTALHNHFKKESEDYYKGINYCGDEGLCSLKINGTTIFIDEALDP